MTTPSTGREGIGLYGLLDDGLLSAAEIPAAATRLALAGCVLMQLRLKHGDDRDRLEVQRQVCAALPDSVMVTLVINDRADLARILVDEAPTHVRAGLHLGQTDLPPALARRALGAKADAVFLGLSTHNLEDVAAAAEAPVDYLGYGPIRTTTTKAAAELSPIVGLDGAGGLSAAVVLARQPIVAIGGLTPQDAPAIAACGARWMAMAGALWRAQESLESTVEQVVASFSAVSLCPQGGL